MSQPTSASLGDLRAIAYALCQDEVSKQRMITDLRAFRNLKTSQHTAETADHVAFIEQATAQELFKIQIAQCRDGDIKKRVENYLQVLRYTKPTEATFKAADSPDPIKNANPKELINVMLALCEDPDVEKRVVNHLRVLRRSRIGGAATAGSNSVALFNSATEMEMRAIGIAMSDADGDVKRRLLESLHVLSIFGELQGTETKNTTFQCLRCKDYFHEEDNKTQSCAYHPGEFSCLYTGKKSLRRLTNSITGRVELGMIPGMDLPTAVDRWSCCFRPTINRGCKTQKHQRQ